MNNAKAAAILICIFFSPRHDDKMMSQLHGCFHKKRASQRKTQLPVPTFCACGWHIDIKNIIKNYFPLFKNCHLHKTSYLASCAYLELQCNTSIPRHTSLKKTNSVKLINVCQLKIKCKEKVSEDYHRITAVSVILFSTEMFSSFPFLKSTKTIVCYVGLNHFSV